MIDLVLGLDIDKLNTVRRSFSLEMDLDLTNSEVVEKLISMEFLSIRNKSKYDDVNSKLVKIRRKLSFELDKDIKSSEVIPLILEKAYIKSQRKGGQPYKINPQLIYDELSKGTTVDKCAQKLGVSKMTIFRAKARLREKNC